jgi:predicted TIM-barrel fold metal-dependent hydrolase
MPGPSLPRRDFCRRAVAGTLAGPLLTARRSLAETPDQMPIIDTHQHLWDLTRFELPWLGDYGPLRKNYSLADYRKATEGVNIVKTIYMEVDVAPGQREAEADYVINLCKQDGSKIAGAVLGWHGEGEHFEGYVRKLTTSGVVKGIRTALRGKASERKFELDRDFVAGIRLLGGNNLSFDINVPPDQLSRAAALVDLVPDTRYILDHCGNADVRAKPADVERWKRGIADVARRKGIVCKISGFISNSKGHKPTAEEIAAVVNHVYDCFGPERVMFAGDWPVCTLAMPLAGWVGTLKQVVADRPMADRRKLFHDNAAQFYGVENTRLRN